jgi:hypothetical protein
MSILFLALSFAVHAIPLVPVEYDALFEFFNGTACPTTVCPVWARSADCLNVLGLTCVDGHVTRLQMGSFGLTGTLSSALSLLTGLTALYMAVNSLHGPIDAVFTLTQLTSLGLNHNNRLNGALSSRLGSLSLLTELLLQENNFSQTIPTEIGRLQRLTYLGLSNNSFIGTLPTEMLQLTRLVSLYADGNELSGVAPVPQSVVTCFLQSNCLQCGRGRSCSCGQRSSPCAAPPQTLTLPPQITTNATVSTWSFPLSACGAFLVLDVTNVVVSIVHRCGDGEPSVLARGGDRRWRRRWRSTFDCHHRVLRDLAQTQVNDGRERGGSVSSVVEQERLRFRAIAIAT